MNTIRYAIFPATLGTGLLITHSAIQAGHSEFLTVALITGSAAIITLLFERVIPYLPRWNQSIGDVRTDTLHALLSTAAIPEIFKLLCFGALLSISETLQRAAGSTLWPHAWPIWVQAPTALLVAEFGQYWVHRLGHEVDLFWRLHSIHHSAGRLYWLNSGRFHPLDTFLQYGSEVTLLTLLGAGPEVMALYTVFTTIHGLFQHCNIDVRLGPLNWIFSMAELHRWHHSKKIEEANMNYGSNLLFWDIVFKTVFYPKRRVAPADIGIEDMPNFPRSYIAHLAVPFRWNRVKSESAVTLTHSPALR